MIRILQISLIFITDYLEKASDDGSFAGSIFVDLAKAFDTINHQILIPKLEAMGISGPAFLRIGSCLHNRNQVISVSESYLKQKTANIGVPQGSIKGPLLFLIYINNLPNFITHCNCLQYAGDTTIRI